MCSIDAIILAAFAHLISSLGHTRITCVMLGKREGSPKMGGSLLSDVLVVRALDRPN
jgi:hypothetical protein